MTRAVGSLGWSVVGAHEVEEDAGHGFIDSQRRSIEVFRSLPPDAPMLVLEAVWQCSHHLLAGLRGHCGPILVLANGNGASPDGSCLPMPSLDELAVGRATLEPLT